MEISDALRRELALLCGGGFESEVANSDSIETTLQNLKQNPNKGANTHSSSQFSSDNSTQEIIHRRNESNELSSIILGMQNNVRYNEHASSVVKNDMSVSTSTTMLTNTTTSLSTTRSTAEIEIPISYSVAKQPELAETEVEKQDPEPSSPPQTVPGQVPSAPTVTKSNSKTVLSNAEIVNQILSVAVPAPDKNLTPEQQRIEEQNLIDIKRTQIETATGGEYSLGDTLDDVYRFGQNLSGYNEFSILGKSGEKSISTYMTKLRNPIGDNLPDLNVVNESESNSGADLEPSINIDSKAIECAKEKSTTPLDLIASSGEPHGAKALKLTGAQLLFQSIQSAINRGNKDFVKGPVHPCQVLNVGSDIKTKPTPKQGDSLESNKRSQSFPDEGTVPGLTSNELPSIVEIPCRATSPPGNTETPAPEITVAVPEKVDKHSWLTKDYEEISQSKEKVEELSEVVQNFEGLCVETESVLNQVVDSLANFVERGIASCGNYNPQDFRVHLASIDTIKDNPTSNVEGEVSEQNSKTEAAENVKENGESVSNKKNLAPEHNTDLISPSEKAVADEMQEIPPLNSGSTQTVAPSSST